MNATMRVQATFTTAATSRGGPRLDSRHFLQGLVGLLTFWNAEAPLSFHFLVSLTFRLRANGA